MMSVDKVVFLIGSNALNISESSNWLEYFRQTVPVRKQPSRTHSINSGNFQVPIVICSANKNQKPWSHPRLLGSCSSTFPSTVYWWPLEGIFIKLWASPEMQTPIRLRKLTENWPKIFIRIKTRATKLLTRSFRISVLLMRSFSVTFSQTDFDYEKQTLKLESPRSLNWPQIIAICTSMCVVCMTNMCYKRTVGHQCHHHLFISCFIQKIQNIEGSNIEKSGFLGAKWSRETKDLWQAWRRGSEKDGRGRGPPRPFCLLLWRFFWRWTSGTNFSFYFCFFYIYFLWFTLIGNIIRKYGMQAIEENSFVLMCLWVSATGRVLVSYIRRCSFESRRQP